MERTMKKLIIMTAILVGLSVPALAEIEIKGFKLDMTKKEAKSNLKAVRIKSKWLNAKLIPHYYMTLAGIDVETPRLWYDKKNKAEGKPVVELAWSFCYSGNEYCQMQGAQHSPTTFALVVEALKTKYPLECTTSTLQNGFGATFEDRTCYYREGDIVLRTNRYENRNLSGQAGSIRIYRDNGDTEYKTDDL
jgi:hypothetical protein